MIWRRVSNKTMVFFFCRADGSRRVDGAGASLGHVLSGEQSHVHEPDLHIHSADRRQVSHRLQQPGKPNADCGSLVTTNIKGNFRFRLAWTGLNQELNSALVLTLQVPFSHLFWVHLLLLLFFRSNRFCGNKKNFFYRLYSGSKDKSSCVAGAVRTRPRRWT